MTDQPRITPESLAAQLEYLKSELDSLIDQLDLDSAVPQPGEWTPRQILSHIIGSLQRSPVYAGYFVASISPVPVTFSDPYWIDAWHLAPSASFKLAYQSAIEANKALVHGLAPDVFWRTLPVVGFGELPLAVFLMVNYKNHITDMHIPQLRAYLPSQSS
jgi:hypothetical protein